MTKKEADKPIFLMIIQRAEDRIEISFQTPDMGEVREFSSKKELMEMCQEIISKELPRFLNQFVYGLAPIARLPQNPPEPGMAIGTVKLYKNGQRVVITSETYVKGRTKLVRVVSEGIEDATQLAVEVRDLQDLPIVLA